jgi:hypothetical protein
MRRVATSEVVPGLEVVDDLREGLLAFLVALAAYLLSIANNRPCPLTYSVARVPSCRL